MPKLIVMKLAFTFLIIALISESSNAQIRNVQLSPSDRANSLAHINQLISEGQCGEADGIARATVRPPLLHTVLGLVELDCRKNRQAAVNLLALAAEQRESVAIETLNSLGIQVSSATRPLEPSSIGRNSDYVAPPPPHTLSPLPQPRQRIVVVPPPVIIVPNPNACIQDGGSVYCRR
jgi:hypothetical protein